MAKKNKNPEIRFKEFTDDWEQKNLDEEVTFYSGLTYSPSNVVKKDGALVLRSSNVKKGLIVFYDNVFVKPEIVNSDNVKTGDIIVVVRNGSRSLIGKHAVVAKEMNNTVIGAFMTGLRPKESNFINALLDTNQFIIEVEKNLGATINQITTGAFKKMSFMFPKATEQKQIGAFFQNLDSLITQHQKKYDKLVILKKAMLEKMFPKSGAVVPEIRFKGFTEDWVEKPFGEFALVRRGLTYSPNDVSDKGVKVLRSSNIYEGSFVQKEDDVYVREEAVNIELAKNKDILITSANGSSRLVGKHTVLENLNSKTVHGGFMLIVRTDKPFFLNASMSSSWYSKFISQNVLGGNGAIGNLKSNDLEEQNILIPEEDEQRKIGDYYKNLDKQIGLHQTQLEKLNNIKKACFSKMFVSQD